MAKIYYVVPEDNSLKAKVKAWVKNRKTDAQVFWDENKEEIVVLAPAAIGLAALGIRTLSRHAALAKEQRLKDLYVYDNSTRRYWELRRKLSTSEKLELERRVDLGGEKLGQVLEDLRVLK